MIFFACENGKGAVDRLRKNDAHQLMGEGHGGDGQPRVARALDLGGKPVRGADDKA